MNSTQTFKEGALASLGGLLHSYAHLQAQYTTSVHMPDFQAFSDRWEKTLYLPIRSEVSAVLNRRQSTNCGGLLYCAPGPHTPLLRDVGEGSLSAYFNQVTLLDIDSESLRSAKQRLTLHAESTRIDSVAMDFSGPFGQRLCDIFLAALCSTRTAAEVLTYLAPSSALASSIFGDADFILEQLTQELDKITGGRRYSCLVSEMVASFTGTAVWLAFRSALYERFARKIPIEELQTCLNAATRLWQLYNEHFLGFHLDFLRRQVEFNGFIVLVFDTCKVYDQPELASLPALTQTAFLLGVLASRRLRIAHRTALSWRDHPNGFDVHLYGIPISDFQAHTHNVELYFLEVAN